MKKIIVILIALTNVSNVYSDNFGIGQIILYLINNQGETKKIKSITFQKKELAFFGITRRLSDSNIFSYPKEQIINIQKILNEYHCLMTYNEVLIHLIKKNTHNTILKITYFGDHYTYYYSEPLKINGCNLVVGYEENDTPNTIPKSGAGSLMIFGINKENSLCFIISEEIFHMD